MARTNTPAVTTQLTGAQKAAATRQAKADAAKAEQLRQARAEVRAKRKAERDAAAAAAAHAQARQPEAEHVNVETLFDDTFELPSWKRVTVGVILGLVGAGFVGYGIGMVMAYALAGIATLTASTAVAFCLSALVWVLGLYASWKIGGWVGGKIFASVVLPDGLAARSAKSISNAVGDAKNWMASRPFVETTRAQAEAFSGAYVKPARAA